MHVTSEVQEHAPAHWDDEIDLRQLVEVLLRRKWLIFGLIVAAVALAGIYSFFVLPPRYEATMTVALPAVDGEDGLGMSVNAYRAFAFSNRVLGAMIEDGGLNMTPPGVEARLQASLDSESRLLKVTASAQTSAEAHQLVLLWRDAFQKQVSAYVQEQVDGLSNAARREAIVAEQAFAKVQEALSTFDRESPIGVHQARLARLEQQLAAVEVELQQLIELAIPVDAARVQLLEDALGSEVGVLDVDALADIIPAGPVGGRFVGTSSYLHPVYELASAKARLATNREAVGLLRERVESLHTQIASEKEAAATLHAVRQRLQHDVDVAEPAWINARLALGELESIERRLGQLTQVRVVVDPTLPETPVAPRKMLNMAVAGFLAAFISVVGALFHEFWYGNRI